TGTNIIYNRTIRYRINSVPGRTHAIQENDMTDVTRRRLLAAAGWTAGATVVAGLGGTGALSAQEALIRSTHFGGPYQALNALVGKPFAQAGLGRVEYDVEVSPSVIAKLQTQRGNPPFDVAMVSRSFGLRALNA